MVSTAQIAYPAAEDERREEGHDDRAGDSCRASDGDGADDAVFVQGLDEELVEGGPVEEEPVSAGESVPADRSFDISPEEFCADSYEQDGCLSSRQELGKKGEDAAVRYLRMRGYTIVKRNWFCRFGEADIIARDPEGTLCFIEVKTRQSVEAGLPEEAVTAEKQRRYERIALCYMMATDDWDDDDCIRFDAIGICVTAPHRALLRHHKGCFNGSL